MPRIVGYHSVLWVSSEARIGEGAATHFWSLAVVTRGGSSMLRSYAMI